MTQTELDNFSGIYKIQSILFPDKIYIGSAVRINKRKNQHSSALKTNKHFNRKLQNHYNKYGESDLYFSILTYCEKTELIKKEQYFIDSIKPWFNIRLIADSNLGIKRTEEYKKKLSKLRSVNNNRSGMHHSEIALQKMRKPHRPYKRSPCSDKTRKILSETHMGDKNPMYNKYVSEKTRNKLRESTKRIWELRKLNKIAS